MPVDLLEPWFLLTALAIIVIPTWWNLTARLEYKTRFLTRLCCGRAHQGAYTLAALIFLVSSLRTWLFQVAVARQHQWPSLGFAGNVALDAAAYIFLATGAILVAGAYYRLGILHTYLADYFGLLMQERVTGFPYDVLDDPMYIGSTLLYLGDAVLARSAIGLLLTVLIGTTYWVATHFFEGPFTAHIYTEAARANAKGKRQD